MFGEQPGSCADDSVPEAKLIQGPENSPESLSVVLQFEVKENRPAAPCEINYYNPLDTQTKEKKESVFLQTYFPSSEET